ncbi:MAG: mannitol-1-phosphate 5-dehydrogenase [Anaerolineae bacterium]|nr:mannitol-1-phosphate 5-dehydrogenase [Anaerolineae bacterium]
MQQHPSAVIFGAGSVGRGFLGQLFSESGYDVVFVDVDAPLIEALASRGSYTLRLAGIDKTEELTIGPVRAVSGTQPEQVAAEVARASLLATAVGARALAAIARPIAAGLARRWEQGETAPLNVIICENLHDAPDLLRGYVEAALPERLRPMVQEQVGFVPAVIARMSPVPTPEQRAADPALIVAEPYKVLPVDRLAFAGAIPDVVGMEAVTPFVAYTERKLYIHNAGHAILGYLGYRRGYTYGYEALTDPHVRPLLNQALGEAGRALTTEHGFTVDALAGHTQDLLARFANRALADPVSRLARDPIRKLAPGDRLVGAARLAEKHNIVPAGLAWGIAAGLTYDDKDDEHAVELQARLARDGLEPTMQALCGIRPDEPLSRLVRCRYDALQRNPEWRKADRGQRMPSA